jgi:hypothetical protein
MPLPHRFPRTARFGAFLAAAIAWSAPAVFAQSSTYDSGFDNGLSRISSEMSRSNNSLNQLLSEKTPETVPMPVYFPPHPPPLNVFPKRGGTGTSYSRQAAQELAAYVNEPFYSVLAARLDRNELSTSRREMLHRYEQEKSVLQHNLRTELGFILAQEPAARPPLFAALAKKQDPQILALEARAEDIRSSLYKRDYAWDAAIKPRITYTEDNAKDPDDIAHVMQGAAAFQNGLNSDQRTVLREIALEVMSGAMTARDAANAQPYLFFSPGPSRVLFPDDLPAEVGAKIAAYQTRKSALRKELYDAIYHEDATWFGIVRTARLRSLAEKQAAEFAALENLAEEIRRELPPMEPRFTSRSVVPLPAGIIERIGALHRRQRTEEREVNFQFELTRARDSDVFALTFFEPDTHRYEFMPRVRTRISASKSAQRAATRVNELLTGYDRIDAGLRDEQDAIRSEIAARSSATNPDYVTRAFNEGLRVALEDEARGAMQDYRRALLEPGLSPAQRRLLFDYAVEHLELPLPSAVMQTKQHLQQPTAANFR